MGGTVGWIGIVGTTSIPTLSGTMLFVLALLLGVITLRTLRTKESKGRLRSVLFMAGASVLLSVVAIEDTRSWVAALIGTGQQCGAQEYTAEFNAGGVGYGDPVQFRNDCPNPVEITLLDIFCADDAPIEGTCAVGGILASNEICTLPRCL